MALTIADCMNLPSLRAAKLIAGSGGLRNRVTSASVLEYAQAPVVGENINMLMEGEIIISALAVAKDSVDEQVKILRFLHSAGVSGLILYYVGVVLEKVDPSFIEVANELDFPILCMSSDRYEARYSEAMGEIFEAILKRKLQQDSLLNVMLERFSQLEEHSRNFNTVLRMLSGHLACSLILADYTFSPLAVAARSEDNESKAEAILRHYAEMRGANRDSWEVLAFPDGEKCSACYAQIVLERHSWMHLIAFRDHENYSAKPDVMETAELLRLFISIWKYEFVHENMNMLIQYIMEDEPIQLKRLLQKLHVDIDDIRVMWIIRGSFDNMPPEQAQMLKSHVIARAGSLLSERNAPIITSIYNGDVIIMIAPSSYTELDADMAEEFLGGILSVDPSITLNVFNNKNTSGDLRAAYILFNSFYLAMRKIYPRKSLYSSQELLFAQMCHQLAVSAAANESREALKLLRSLADGEGLVEALAVFLLDAQGNMQKAGDQLFVHKNTIKYRLKKAQQRLGYNIWEVPASLNLHVAVGVDRLLNDKSTL